MNVYLITISQPFDNNIELIIAAQNKKEAIKLFKIKLSYSLNKEVNSFCKNFINNLEERKEHLDNSLNKKEINNEVYNYYYEEDKSTLFCDKLSFSLKDYFDHKIKFKKQLKQIVFDKYNQKNGSLQGNLDSDNFTIEDLTKKANSKKNSSILNFKSIYVG